MWEIVLIRDANVMRFEEKFRSILLTQINLMKLHLDIDQWIQTLIPSDLTNENSKALIDLLRKLSSEISNRLETQDNNRTSTNDRTSIHDPLSRASAPSNSVSVSLSNVH